MALACNKSEDAEPATYVKDFEHDTNVIGYWIGFTDAEIKSINGKVVVIMSDTSTILPAVSEYRADGADFSYDLKKENGEFIHSYDPNAKRNMNYWYSGSSSATEKVVYDVYSIDGKNISTTLDFDYQVYNTDTLIINDRGTNTKRVLVRLEDPSKIPPTLKIDNPYSGQ